MSIEIWKPVANTDGMHEVSNKGRVRTWRKKGGKRNQPVLQKPTVVDKGYLRVGLMYSDGAKRNQYVHRLVLETFVGPCPEGLEACHKDSVPSNCSVTNLRWDTRLSNHNDKRLRNTIVRGTQHKLAKLTKENVETIRASTLKQKELAAFYGVHPSHISRIVNFKKREVA